MERQGARRVNIRRRGRFDQDRHGRESAVDRGADAHCLFADAEAADQLRVARRILRLQVIEQPAALADEHQQSTAGVVVLRVGLEMLGQVIDTLAENRNLHLGRPGVALVRLVVPDDLGFLVSGQCQLATLHVRPRRRHTPPGRRKSLEDLGFYLRTTAGCKTPAPGRTSASAISVPAASSRRTGPSDALGGASSSIRGSTSRPLCTHRRPSSLTWYPGRCPSSAPAGTRRSTATPGVAMATPSGTAWPRSNSPLLVRRRPARWAGVPTASPRSWARART